MQPTNISTVQGYHSPDSKKIHDFFLTCLDESAGNMSNKCITYEKLITVQIKFTQVILLSCHNQISLTTGTQIP